MSEYNKHPIKLPINKLMWNKLAANSLEKELPNHTVCAGDIGAFMPDRPSSSSEDYQALYYAARLSNVFVDFVAHAAIGEIVYGKN